jgi:hypothetical protein
VLGDSAAAEDAWEILRLFFEEPSFSDLGVVGELDSDATPRCMNFMVIRRDDMVLGVDCAAMVGSADNFCSILGEVGGCESVFLRVSEI